MNVRNIFIDNIRYILTIVVFLICTYSSIFVKHNQITHILLSIVAVQSLVVFSNKSLFVKQNPLEKDDVILNDSTNNSDNSDKYGSKSNKWHWLKKDKPLLDLCQELRSIKRMNNSINNAICDKMNKVSRKYYKELIKKDENMYNNLEKHKISLQFIEDSVKDIIELFKEIEFGTTNEKYITKYDIPEKIDRFSNIMKERLDLLKHKRGLR